MEPMTAPTNAFNNGIDLLVLTPGSIIVVGGGFQKFRNPGGLFMTGFCCITL